MLVTKLRLALWCGLGLWAATACAGDPWLNSQIMPKSDQLLLRNGEEVSGDVYQIAWPATVEKTEGQWLWVSDKGAYNIPGTSGWIRKDDVVKAGEAQAYYMDLLQTGDAPSIHWMLGICLETGGESDTAQQEYLKALSLDAARSADPEAARTAVQMNPNMLDAAIGLQRIRAAGAKSAADAEAAADQLKNLADDAKNRGVRRPHAFFQQAEALNKAYRLKLGEEQKQIRGIDAAIARATSEKDGGTAEDQTLFNKADDLYQITAAHDPSYAQAGPHIWKGCMGRAELYLSRISFLDDEAWALIDGSGAPAAAPATAAATATATASKSTSNKNASTAPIDLKRLAAFCKSWQDPKAAQLQLSKAHAVCCCMAAEIRSLREAVKCFDQAVAQSKDLVEAYRDRGLAYLSLARCEATLAAILTALEKTDPDYQKLLAGLNSDGTLQPQELDRTLVDGRKLFDQALEKLRTATAKEASIAAQKQEIAGVAADLAKNYLKAASQSAGSDGKGHDKAEAPGSRLVALRDQLKQLRSDAAKAVEPFDREEAQVEEDLASAKAALQESYDLLSKSSHVHSAEQSARTACAKGNNADAECLQVLAETFASQCNFDRAVFYQKLAVVFASEDERPQIMQTFRDYTKMDDLLTAKAKAKTPTSAAGPGKGAKPSGGDAPEGGAPEE